MQPSHLYFAFSENTLYPFLEHTVLLCLYWPLSVIGLSAEPCPFCLSAHLTLLFPHGLLFCQDGWGNRFLRKVFKFVPDSMVLHPGGQHSSFLIVISNWGVSESYYRTSYCSRGQVSVATCWWVDDLAFFYLFIYLFFLRNTCTHFADQSVSRNVVWETLLYQIHRSHKPCVCHRTWWWRHVQFTWSRTGCKVLYTYFYRNWLFHVTNFCFCDR